MSVLICQDWLEMHMSRYIYMKSGILSITLCILYLHPHKTFGTKRLMT
jgi:hypothetical protein